MNTRGKPAIAPTPHEPRLARVAAVIADPARSRMLAYLLSGAYASAGELATAGGVGASTASAHLAKLQHGGLVVCEPRGRHRYFRLADGEVAQALSALALVAERSTHASQWARPERLRLREARCCYGHIGGRLGVALLTSLQEQGALDMRSSSAWTLTAAGVAWLARLGFDAAACDAVAAARSSARLAYGCLDWSERRDHLAGSLASQLLRHFVVQGWLRRGQDGDRALAITPQGRRALLPLLGMGEPAPHMLAE